MKTFGLNEAEYAATKENNYTLPVATEEKTVYELMICFGEGGYLYYNTLKSNIKDAMKDWYKAMDHAYMNVDNMEITSAVLRDPDGNDVDEYIRGE